MKILKIIFIILIIFSIYCIGNIYIDFEEIKNNEISNVQNDNIVNEILENHVEIPDSKTITIAAIGDIMCHNSQYIDAYNQDGTYDFSYVFEDIKQYIEPADLAIGNLETTFAGKDIGYSSYPTFNTPENMAIDLKELGIDVVSTANNHSLDKGLKGLKNTIEELDKAEISHTGTYSSEEQNKFVITEIEDIKIGIISYTYGTNGIAVPKGHEYCINLISDEKIKEDLKNVEKENLDVIIAVMHWGEEYQDIPNKEQERLTKLLIENGVDIILGSHPHVLQKMERYDVKLENGEEKEAFVIYSLGNFISGQTKEPRKQSIILNLQITKHYGENEKITIDSAQYTPIYMFDKAGSKRYKLLDIESEILRYEAGEENITFSLYNKLKERLIDIITTVGNEF